MPNMADNKDNAAKDSDILQHLPEAHLQHWMAWKKIWNEDLWGASGDKSQWQSRFCRGNETVLDTLLGNQKSAPHTALTWNLQGKRKRGRPRNRWKRDTEAETREQA
jgi:hypothetical protein